MGILGFLRNFKTIIDKKDKISDNRKAKKKKVSGFEKRKQQGRCFKMAAKFLFAINHQGEKLTNTQREQLGIDVDTEEIKKMAKAFIKAKGHTLSHYDISIQYAIDKQAVYYTLNSLKEKKQIGGNVPFDEVKKALA